MTSGQPPDKRGPILFMVMLAIAGFIAVAGGLSRTDGGEPDDPARPTASPSERDRDRPPRRDRKDRPRPSPSPSADAATYHAIARPRQFTMGVKLFYDDDVRRFDADGVRRIRPAVRFVSYR